MSDVPCNSCTVCCKWQLVILMPEDQPNLDHYDFRTIDRPGDPIRVLNTRENGECVHLGPGGCTIYENRPLICSTFDCRKQFLSMTRNERRKMKNQEMWKAARARLDTLTPAERGAVPAYGKAAKDGMAALLEKFGG